MNYFDFLVLFGTLLLIVLYGVWKTRGHQDMNSYVLGNNSAGWATIGLSVMATQASAITFISTPGQAYDNGMLFVQNYFGLPLALFIVSVFFIPIYYKLKVYTAYEFLESRFDLKTRLLGASLFLIQRGMAAGITIYAPAIILSTLLGWNLTLTIVLTGLTVVVYTLSGGTKAVSITQKQQMAVIMIGMFVAFGILVYYITRHVPWSDALTIASLTQKLQAVDFEFNVEKRYTFWSGITGGLFLALSYFGTDQSQVQRYLGGRDVRESRLGLLFNAILKIPMQYFILFTGVMTYVFYVFYQPPLLFNSNQQKVLAQTSARSSLEILESKHYEAVLNRKESAIKYLDAEIQNKEAAADEYRLYDHAIKDYRSEARQLSTSVGIKENTKDSDYVFLSFVTTFLPHGLIGLLIAVMLSAAMSSSSSEINSLASTSVIDLYKRKINPEGSEAFYVKVSKLFTFVWGLIAVSFALIAKQSENLIEAVNIVGSLFYGTILGIFLVAFFLKRAKGSHVFYAAIVSESIVLTFHFLTINELLSIGYLWYNAIGCGLTYLLAFVFSLIWQKNSP